MTEKETYTPNSRWIGKDYYSTPEMAKAAHTALLKGQSFGLFRTPTQGLRDIPQNHFIITSIKQTMFTLDEAQDIAQDWELLTGYVLLEYSDGKGHWGCLKSAPPRQRYSFTLKQADEEIDELKVKNAELIMRLELANKLVKACVPLAQSYVTYQQLAGQTPFTRWLVGNGNEQQERDSRQQIASILSDKRWGGITK